MISLDKFIKIFKESKLNEEEIKDFYLAMKRSVRAFYLSRRSQNELMKQNKILEPILEKIKPSQMLMLQTLFEEMRKDEEEIKRVSGEERKEHPQIVKRRILENRINYYETILKVSWKDREQYKRMRERIIDLRIKNLGKKSWKYGLGAGITFLGLKFLYSRLRPEKEEEKEEKPTAKIRVRK